MFKTVPPLLKNEYPKIKNPNPNCDSHSGCLLQHYGFEEEEFYTVFFGLSRMIGTMSNFVIQRSLGTPIERPKSVTSDWIAQNVKKS